MKYVPHDYQAYATDFILTHPEAAVLLDMGLGKSVITLTAIQELCLNAFEISRVLVIAPLRVARDTWPAELQKWDHLQGLSYSVAVGTEKERMAALMRPAFLHIINRENVQWLVEDSGLPFRYDMIVIDELSSFKSWQAKRFKSLLKVRPSVKRIVGLTGTPSSNATALWICGQNSGSWTWASGSDGLSPGTAKPTLFPTNVACSRFSPISPGPARKMRSTGRSETSPFPCGRRIT